MATYHGIEEIGCPACGTIYTDTLEMEMINDGAGECLGLECRSTTLVFRYTNGHVETISETPDGTGLRFLTYTPGKGLTATGY